MARSLNHGPNIDAPEHLCYFGVESGWNLLLRSSKTVKKSITHLKLNQANSKKLQKLDELAAEHQRVVQAYVNWLIKRDVHEPNKYANIPEEEVPTSL